MCCEGEQVLGKKIYIVDMDRCVERKGQVSSAGSDGELIALLWEGREGGIGGRRE